MLMSEIWTMTDPRDLSALVDLAVEAEAAGVDTVMIGEHVVLGAHSDVNGTPENPRDWLAEGNHPQTFPHPSGLILLSAIASRTERVRLLAAAVVAPLRHPLVLAKEFLTLDLLAKGRLVVLPNVSWQQEEYEALGVPFHKRGAILDEQLEIWERVWRDSPVSYEGEHFSFADVYVEPKAYRPTGPELWIGGRSLHGPALRRTVRYANGLFLIQPPSEDELARLDAALQEAGRSLDSIELAAIVGGGFTGADDVLPMSAFLDPARELVERGFTSFMIKPSQYIDDPAEFSDFAREAVTRLQELTVD
jgi:alkanesulfonate monooxygenase SsuD/methylene tetrahydromethanopterin reductase-like flavin-dependent oxidoreductase (luciferase family)